MKTKLAFCVMLLCIASTIAVGQQVSVNYDHNTSFAQYHTYAWGSNNKNQVRAVHVGGPRQRLRFLVEGRVEAAAVSEAHSEGHARQYKPTTDKHR